MIGDKKVSLQNRFISKCGESYFLDENLLNF